MSQTFEDEFRFLRGDAARVGVTGTLPTVERVSAAVNEGRTLSALSFSAGEAPQLVAIHGAGLNAHSFDPMLLALGAPALSLDLPGHGRSDWRDDAAYRPDTLAADVILALEHLAPQPVVLLGHSLGGLTAAVVAAQRPDLVTRLVVVDITPGITPSGAGSVNDFITGQRDFATIDEMVDRAIAFGIGSDRAALTRGVALNTRVRPDGRYEWTHHFAHLESLGAAVSETSSAPFAPLWAALEAAAAQGIRVDLVRATDGMVSPAQAAEWGEHLPGSTVVTVPGPHNLHEASPVALADEVRALMRQ